VFVCARRCGHGPVLELGADQSADGWRACQQQAGEEWAGACRPLECEFRPCEELRQSSSRNLLVGSLGAGDQLAPPSTECRRIYSPAARSLEAAECPPILWPCWRALGPCWRIQNPARYYALEHPSGALWSNTAFERSAARSPESCVMPSCMQVAEALLSIPGGARHLGGCESGAEIYGIVSPSAEHTPRS